MKKWFMALGISGTILSMTDILMISALMPIRFTGYYTVAVSVISALMLLIPVGKITLPLFSEVGNSKKALEKRFRKIFYPTIAATFAIAVVLAIVSKPLLSLFYPAEYAQNAWLALSILAFLLPARNAFWLNIQKLIALGRIKDQLWIIGVAATVNLILNALLIPMFGLPGAALASVLSLILGVGVAKIRS